MKQKIILVMVAFSVLCSHAVNAQIARLRSNFLHPGNAYKPGVYWYFNDGNMSKESVLKDLRSMNKAGIGSALFLEVNVGLPQGKTKLLSPEWLSILSFAFDAAKKLGITITVGIGPGWQGSGGPWVRPERSMQTLVASETVVSADDEKEVFLSIPAAPEPYFKEDGLTPEMKKARDAYYRDVAVVAIPFDDQSTQLKGYREKALYYRGPFSSTDTVKPFIPVNLAKRSGGVTDLNKVILLTGKMDNKGKLNWRPAQGRWKVLRFVSRNNGAVSRPAPLPGFGFESDKLDTLAIKNHLDTYLGKLLKGQKAIDRQTDGGLKTLHIDSWESSSQNWTPAFLQQFKKRRGYDPLPYLPTFNGHTIINSVQTERFLWDVRLTLQDLLFENHVSYIKKYAQRRGLSLSIEPYDLNQTSDLDLGSFADEPSAEFWSKGFGFNTAFSAAEASSIAHINGKTVVRAEAFTALPSEGWRQHPASMKDQGDWAFAAGINKFFFHTFANQFLPDSLKPGVTMGPFGVHWDSGQTWWPMVPAYHGYLTRCQYLLQQGRTVADILYLTPEGAPDVFLPPPSALTRDSMGDRKGFNFDGCTGNQLKKAFVRHGNIHFPSGASYQVLILPAIKTITPELLSKIETLIKAGATVIGQKPVMSPSLAGFPWCDKRVNILADRIWGSKIVSEKLTFHKYGRGTIITGGEIDLTDGGLYPSYKATAYVLKQLGHIEDFSTDATVRYTHRRVSDGDIYFCANTSDRPISFDADFRTVSGAPELWKANEGYILPVKHFYRKGSVTQVTLSLDAHESCFVIFEKGHTSQSVSSSYTSHIDTLKILNEDWKVVFDPKWGGPTSIYFKKLADWSEHEDEGIRYYSGIAAYQKKFDMDKEADNDGKYYVNLGEVKNIARVKFNGRDLGVVWTAPWKVDISGLLKKKDNLLEIEVANLWPNRLIGDARQPYDGPRDGQWPDWIRNGTPRPTKRYAFATSNMYDASTKLFRSGLLGPVAIVRTTEK